jgi:DNA-binding NarL/FixJ family response regulator
MAAGACGYLILPVTRSELVRAVLRAEAKLPGFCQRTERLMGTYTIGPGPAPPDLDLSSSEYQVFACLQSGLSEKETMEALRMKLGSVSSLRNRIRQKLSAAAKKDAGPGK